MTQLKNATLFITGASSGIGAATARDAARQGAHVILTARREEALARVAQEIRDAGGTAHVYPADLTDPVAVTRLCDAIRRDHGCPDVIVNNAGAGPWRYLDESSPEEVQRMMAAPYLAAAWISRAFLPDMLERNAGHLVTLTSVAAHFTWPGATAYTAARWAMRGLHEALTADLASTKIRTTLATFAKVDSSYFETNACSEERVPGAQSMIRVLKPEQAARAIVRGVRRNRRHVVAPFGLRLILWNFWLFPGITRWLMRLTGHRRPALPATTRTEP